MARARQSAFGLLLSSVLLAGCSSTASYGTHQLNHEWSLFGICGPYSRTWLEDSSGKAVVSGIERRSASPDHEWLVLFDLPGPSRFYLLDVERDALQTIKAPGYVREESFRWSPDGTKLAFLAGKNPTRLCIVPLSAEPSVEVTPTDSREASELAIEWRDGTARLVAR